MTPPGAVSAAGAGAITLRVKAVPGSSRDRIAGVLGDRLKVCVTAPPEGGKANAAIAALLARALGVAGAAVELRAGRSGAEKAFVVLGVSEGQARERLGIS